MSKRVEKDFELLDVELAKYIDAHFDNINRYK
jgi:hypothetical protein